jgi:UDP-N-acetylmuramate--alanine ligase
VIDTGTRVHFVGIGGIGMSGLASVLLARGDRISGSDVRANRELDSLRRAGASVYIGHDERHVPSNLDRVIVSSAIPPDNVEVRAARRRRIPVVRRLDALAGVLRSHRSVGIAGTHGKTTTTAMLATIHRALDRSPSYLIGAHCPGLGGNARLDSGEWFVAEIDESDGLFLTIEPDVAVLTNVGLDHMQTYRDLREIESAFARYVSQAGHAVLAVDDPRVQEIAGRVPAALTVGIHRDADIRASDLRFEKFRTTFALLERGREVARVSLPAPGEHNVENALCALGAARLTGIELAEAAQALSSFVLPHRRFELLEENGVTVVDDYAHLPEEIEATLRAIRCGWRDRRIVAIFQPHRYSRTQALSSQFGPAFSLADTVIVTSIYPACETPVPGVSSQTIVRAIERETDAEVRSIAGKEEAVGFLKKTIVPGDFIVSFGAGDIWTVTEELAHFLEQGQFCTV